ncbi:MAG: nicotinate-nucleotide--dimethylbenzimidazole phosphoribosyltransferase [Bacteroidales bacterium]
MEFSITKPNQEIVKNLQKKTDNKTKPQGSLGKLEEIAIKTGLIQQTETPELNKPHILVFSADHGIASEGVSSFPQEVTQQMVHNFVNGGAAINVFARQNNICIKIVDAGVKGELPENTRKQILNHKMGNGTRNFLHEPAMTIEQCQEAIHTGAKVTQECYENGCNIIGFGEMGIGNTSSSAVLMHLITGMPMQTCIGKGTGLDEKGLQKKQKILEQAIEKFDNNNDPLNILAHFGGFELAMITGAFLQAASLKMTILVDGFNVTAALLIAHKMHPAVLDYCIFTHQSDEKGHKKMLEYLNAEPILNLGMRLGEGTGAALAYPIVNSAVNFFNLMASFEDAGVENRK